MPKDGKTARPKFHVLLPLSQPLTDKEMYVRYCTWFIKNFQGDPKVKSLAQMLFGYINRPATDKVKHLNALLESLDDTGLYEYVQSIY